MPINENETSTTALPALIHDMPDGFSVAEHAATCGVLDCGHLYRGPSDTVRRAVLVYIAQANGVAIDLDLEAPAVAGVVGSLRAAGQTAPTYVRGVNAAGNAGYVRTAATTVLPDVTGFRMTPERRAVFTAMWQGYSLTTIAAAQGRTVATVKSHAGNLRRLNGAHDAPSALVALVLAGQIDAQ